MRIPLALVAVCAAAQALDAQTANVTGRWVGPATTADDGLEMTVALRQSLEGGGDGGAITGYILGRMTETVTAGKWDGAQLLLEAERPGRDGNVMKIVYRATIDGVNGKMKLTMPGMGPGGPPGGAQRPPGALQQQQRPRQVFELTRVSTETPVPLPPRPAPVTLPMPAGQVPPNALAKTPPMGWNSWNKFRNQVSDKLIREIADAMVSSGMRDAGYVYVNIDDTWEGAHRDANGNITTNNKFPDMKALADYVHSKGLKLGIYSSPGPKTCAGYAGSYQHEEQDARTFAAWGIDYLKYDWCSAREVYDGKQATMAAAYAKMGQALANSGRPIVYSLCQYGLLDVGEWGAKVGANLWRTTGDISDRWESMSRIGFDQQVERGKYAAPGRWNDPDMLEVGNGGMTTDEYRTHMSLWALLAAPLLAGNDIRNMSPETAEILLNREVIAVDQDPLGKQAERISKTGDVEVWSRPLANGSRAIGLFNRGKEPATVSTPLEGGEKKRHQVRDVWKHADLPTASGEFTAQVPGHGVVMVRVK